MSQSQVNINWIIFDDGLIILPFMQVLKTIASHYYAKLVAGIFFLQVYQGGCRIGRFWQVKFNVYRFNSVVAFNGKPQKMEPVIFIQKRSFFFEGVLWRDNKPNLLEIAIIQKMISYDQVPEMDWVKGTKI